MQCTVDELKAICDKHFKWLRNEEGGERADLSRADLSRANLSGANLFGANLSGALNAEIHIARTRICPDGQFDAWKKLKGGILCRVRIPSGAKRSNATGRKCRAEYVKVLEVIGAESGVSIHDGKTEYRKGATVRAHEWCDNQWRECDGGIHFYLTKEEAEAHQ